LFGGVIGGMAITVPLSDFSRRTTGVTRVLAVLAAARPDLAAWRSTAVAWADPEVRLALADADNNEEPDPADSVIARPGV